MKLTAVLGFVCGAAALVAGAAFADAAPAPAKSRHPRAAASAKPAGGPLSPMPTAFETLKTTTSDAVKSESLCVCLDPGAKDNGYPLKGHVGATRLQSVLANGHERVTLHCRIPRFDPTSGSDAGGARCDDFALVQ